MADAHTDNAAQRRQLRRADDIHVRNILTKENILELFSPDICITAREACNALHINTNRRKLAARVMNELVGERKLIALQRLNGDDPTYTLRPNPVVERVVERVFDSEDDERRRLCIVCRDRERSELVLPCRHLCICLTCLTQMREGVAEAVDDAMLDDQLRCPVCRGLVEDSITALFA